MKKYFVVAALMVSTAFVSPAFAGWNGGGQAFPTYIQPWPESGCTFVQFNNDGNWYELDVSLLGSKGDSDLQNYLLAARYNHDAVIYYPQGTGVCGGVAIAALMHACSSPGTC